MAPERFSRLLDSNASYTSVGPPVEPESSTTIERGEPILSENPFFVPGGRFLITSVPSSLNIWDLGPHDCEALAEPVLAACKALEVEEDNNAGAPLRDTKLAVHLLSENTLRVVVVVCAHQTTYVRISFHRPSCLSSPLRSAVRWRST